MQLWFCCFKVGSCIMWKVQAWLVLSVETMWRMWTDWLPHCNMSPYLDWFISLNWAWNQELMHISLQACSYNCRADRCWCVKHVLQCPSKYCIQDFNGWDNHYNPENTKKHAWHTNILKSCRTDTMASHVHYKSLPLFDFFRKAGEGSKKLFWGETLSTVKYSLCKLYSLYM